MIRARSLILILIVQAVTFGSLVRAADSSTVSSKSSTAAAAATAAAAEVNKVCPVSGRPVDPGITFEYEGRTYAFATASDREKYRGKLEASLYHRLGGRKAIDTAVEAFYVKILADDRIKHYFEDISMNKQRRRQKEFLSAAMGGPIPYTGKDLRRAHEDLPGLGDVHFNAVAEHLKSTLEDLKVDPGMIREVMTLVGGARDAVLNRTPASK